MGGNMAASHVNVIKMCSDMELNIFKFSICNYATLNTPCFHKQKWSFIFLTLCPRDFTLVCQAEVENLKGTGIKTALSHFLSCRSRTETTGNFSPPVHGGHDSLSLQLWLNLFFCFAASSAFRRRSAKLQLADAPEPPHAPPADDWQLQLAKEALNTGE